MTDTSAATVYIVKTVVAFGGSMGNFYGVSEVFGTLEEAERYVEANRYLSFPKIATQTVWSTAEDAVKDRQKRNVQT